MPAVRPAIWRFALSLSGRPDVADDLTQATCLRALEKAAQFAPGTRLDAWCLTICRSIWLNDLRARTLRDAGQLDRDAEQVASISPPADVNIFASEVFSQVMGLPEAQRATVMLVYVEGHSYREAAEILDIPIGTVMSRLATARRVLTEWMETPAQGPEG